MKTDLIVLTIAVGVPPTHRSAAAAHALTISATLWRKQVELRRGPPVFVAHSSLAVDTDIVTLKNAKNLNLGGHCSFEDLPLDVTAALSSPPTGKRKPSGTPLMSPVSDLSHPWSPDSSEHCSML
jgi:hypothetical protein